MRYAISESAAFKCSMVTNVALVLATIAALFFAWWYLVYVFFVFLPAIIVVAVNYGLIQPPLGWSRTLPPWYRAGSGALLVIWLAVSGIRAIQVPWLGH